MSNPPKKPADKGIFVIDIPGRPSTKYPAWRYHEWQEPMIVNNEEEDERAKRHGWLEQNRPVTVVRHLLNQRFDLEDFTARQLVQYALDEYGVDLPIEAGKEKLFKAIWRLSMAAPENEGRIVMMANALEMNYDETLIEIKKLADKREEITTEEFFA